MVSLEAAARGVLPPLARQRTDASPGVAEEENTEDKPLEVLQTIIQSSFLPPPQMAAAKSRLFSIVSQIIQPR